MVKRAQVMHNPLTTANGKGMIPRHCQIIQLLAACHPLPPNEHTVGAVGAQYMHPDKQLAGRDPSTLAC